MKKNSGSSLGYAGEVGIVKGTIDVCSSQGSEHAHS